MKTIATLPTLKPGEVWFCDPYWRDWSPIGEDELSVWNRERAARRLSPVQSGTPPAGSKVWNRTMKTIATLPPLGPGQVWYYHPAWVYWERIGAADLTRLNIDRVAHGLPPYRPGTPPACAEVRWDGETAIYLPGVTT